MTDISSFEFNFADDQALHVTFSFERTPATVPARKAKALEFLQQLEAFVASLNAAAAKPVAPAPPAPQEPRAYKLIDIDMLAHPSGLFTAKRGIHIGSGMSEGEALAELEAKLKAAAVGTPPTQATPAPEITAPPPVPTSPPELHVVPPLQEAPAAEPRKPATAPPQELVTAQGFPTVLKWFLAHGVQAPEAILEKCTEWKDVVPALQRLQGDMSDRIRRGLYVLSQQGG